MRRQCACNEPCATEALRKRQAQMGVVATTSSVCHICIRLFPISRKLAHSQENFGEQIHCSVMYSDRAISALCACSRVNLPTSFRLPTYCWQQSSIYRPHVPTINRTRSARFLARLLLSNLLCFRVGKCGGLYICCGGKVGYFRYFSSRIPMIFIHSIVDYVCSLRGEDALRNF